MYIRALIGAVLLVFSVMANSSEEEIPSETAKGIASALALGLASEILNTQLELECEISNGADTTSSSTDCIELLTKTKVELEYVLDRRCTSPSQEDFVCAELNSMLDKVKRVDHGGY